MSAAVSADITNVLSVGPGVHRRWAFCAHLREWAILKAGLSAVVIILVSLAQAVDAQTIFNALNVNFPNFPAADNKFGVRYFDAAFGATDVPSSDGNSLLLFDPVEFAGRWAALGETTVPAKLPEIRLPFVGSGVDVNYLADNIGESFEWEIVEGGSGDSYYVVASGTVNTNSAGAGFVQSTAAIVPQGTLPTDRIHMLRLKAIDTDGLGGGGNWRVFIDTVGVHDNIPLTYDDDSNFSGNWNFATPSNWDIGFADNGFYEATRSGTPAVDEKVDISFTGTSLVLSGMQWGDTDPSAAGEFRVTGSYDWEIDGGLYGSGTIDSSLDVSTGLRWPELVINNLPSGPHTLTLTNRGNAGAFQSLGYMIFDSLATFDSGVTVAAGDYNRDGVVDGLDYNAWASSYGSSVAPFSGADGNRDGVIDAADYTIWRDAVGASLAIAVPEPASVASFLVAIGSLLVLRRR
jgi:hypothetical protein